MVADGILRHLRWHASTKLLEKIGWRRGFSRLKRKRVLFLSEPGSISQSQVFPFHFYERELFARWRHELRELPTAEFEAAPEKAPGHADVVCVQTWFDLTPERCGSLFKAIRMQNPDAKIVYMDSFAPTDLRLAAMLDPYIDVYVKKHVFRDRARYLEPTKGDTNLVDYYGKLYGLNHTEIINVIPEGFLRKLFVGPSFFTAPYMLPQFFNSPRSRTIREKIDVHARLGASGGGWYQMMRENAIEVINGLQELTVASGFGLAPWKYRMELRTARTCFSPFGYGEVCWRDYEAVLFGALLIKPDMGHVETSPDIFIPNDTYVPVAWDFSDVPEVIEKWLRNSTDRKKITEQAYKLLHDYSKTSRFVAQMTPIFSG